MAILKEWVKQPSDIQDYQVDFTSWLTGLSDTALSYVVTVETGITKVSDSRTAGVVTVRLSGGLHENNYKVTVQLTSLAGLVKEVEILIKVRED